MVSTRTTFQLLVALSAAGAASASYLNYPEARSVMLSHQEYSRGYEGALVLSARDLSLLGVRADDISHVLVIRGPGSRSPSPSPKEGYQKQLAVHEAGLANANRKVSEARDKIRDARRAKDTKTENFWKNELQSAQEMVKYEQEEIDEYKRLIAHAK
jgi:hypothetical protein